MNKIPETSYTEQILKAKSEEKAAHIIYTAMCDYSEKISAACTGYEDDNTFIAATLELYARLYKKMLTPEQQEFMRRLVVASQDAAEERITAVPTDILRAAQGEAEL